MSSRICCRESTPAKLLKGELHHMQHHFSETSNEKIVRSAKIMHLCSSIVFLIGGLLILFVSGLESMIGNVIVGASSIIIGCTGIYGYFSNDMYRLAFQSDFALGIFNVLLGILLIISPRQVHEMLPTAIAVLALLDGGNKSQIALEGWKFGMHKWYLVLISALAEVASGIIILVFTYQGFDTSGWMGSAMMLVGIINFWTTMYTVRICSKAKQNTDGIH